MSEHEYKRKRRPVSRREPTASAERVYSAPNSNATLRSGQQLGIGYQSGPLYNLAGMYFEQGEAGVTFRDIDAVANQLANPGTGDALQQNQRLGLERRFGRDFSQVRIHTGPIADKVTGALRAKALTHRQHIWLGHQASITDDRLIAHELTHVAQQGFAPTRSHRAPIGLSPAARTPAHSDAAATSRGSTQRPTAGPSRAAAAAATPATVQRIDLWDTAVNIGGSVVSGVGSAVEFVSEIPGNLASLALSELRPLVRRIAPNFYNFFANGGVSGFLNRLVQRGIRSLFSGIMNSIRNVVNLDNLGRGFDQAREWLSTVTEQFSSDACDAVLGAASRVREFFSDTFGPVIDKISSVSCQVKTFLNGIWESIGTPIWDFLRNVGGDIWEGLQGFIRDAGRLIREAREALGGAWDTIKDWLGIEAEEGTSEGGGLWNWIRDQVSEIGSSIADLVRPIMGPLRDAAGVLLLLVPGGQIFAVMALWPRLRQAFDWISEVWSDLNLIPRARAFLTETVFPALMDAAEAVAQALLSQADWLVGTLSSFVGTVASVVDMIPNVLLPMRPVITFVLGLFRQVLGFARSGIQYVSRNFRSLARRLIRFIGIILDGLVQLISIALNPFGIVGFLAGTLWRLIPECLKGPFIDFILNTIIGFLRTMPPLPMLGILWPVIKSAMLGFLQTVLDLTLARKVNISNRIALIISGMSPTFVFGFFRGIVLGLWEAITGPITAIAMVFELPTMLQEFLGNLGVRLCELVEQIRCFAAELTTRIFGSLDSVLSAIGEFLQEPSRIIELIRCAIEGILSGARQLGSQIATRLIDLFEGPVDAIGEQLGRVASHFLVQAVITYFTAGAGTAVTSGLSIVRQIATALRTLGRAIRQIVQIVRGLFGRLVGFLRGLASKFGRAVVRGGRSILGRLGGFFRRVARWFGRLLGRMGRAIRRRFMLSPAQRLRWIAFQGEVRSRTQAPSGMTKSRLRGIYRGILNRYRTVAKRPAFITKHGPHWRLWVRRVKSIRPRRVGEVLLDRNSRWRAGARAIARAFRRIKRRPGDINTGMVQRILTPIGRRYHYRGAPRVTFEGERNQFEVNWAMSNGNTAARLQDKLPRNLNNFIAVNPGRIAVLDNFVSQSGRGRSPAVGSMVDLERIRSWPNCVTTAYVKGHLISGHFTHGYWSNWTPITRSANYWMEQRWETLIRRQMPRSLSAFFRQRRRLTTGLTIASNKPPVRIYELKVEAHGSSPAGPSRVIKDPSPSRCVPNDDGSGNNPRRPGARRRGRIHQERNLARVIRMTIVRKEQDNSGSWRKQPGLRLLMRGVRSPSDVVNVPNQVRYGGTADRVNRSRGIHGFPGGDIEP